MADQRAGPPGMEVEVMEELVAFVREWLPAPARHAYRRLMEEDPKHWTEHPHFADGFVVRHVLHGNGVTEAALGEVDLERIWPEVLQRAVMDQGGNRA